MRKLAGCLAFLAGIGMFSQASSHTLREDPETVYRPTGRGTGEVDTDPQAAARNRAALLTTGSNGITYHNGPVLTNPAKVHLIWYGDWQTKYSAAQAIIVSFISNLSGSPIYGTNTSYYNATKVAVPNQVSLAGQGTDTLYSQGKALTDAAVFNIVKSYVKTAPDTNAVYFVLTSPDVTETSGFGTKYCGWHTYGSVNNVPVKYSFVGNPLTIAPAGCGVNTPSPNGDGGADAMISVIFHELSETVTDPQLSAWYDSTGYENADKCAWKFGTTFKTGNGALANVTLATNSKSYLIQQNWVNATGGYCSLK